MADLSREPQGRRATGALAGSSSPIFLLCTARSGSTLLRYCLDSHPDISCPPESNLAGAFCAIQHLEASLRVEGCDLLESQARADRLCRALADETLGELARRQQKTRWCDKSLPSVGHADLLNRVFPDAQFIAMHRHCADFIVSAVEACPWGYHAYGFEPYVRQSPENFVLALGRYWADATEAELRFAEAHPDRSLAVRYEDLVTLPEGTLSALFQWLGVSWEKSLASPEVIFGTPHSSLGPGDHKILYTNNFDPSSVGQGWRVPLGLLPVPLKDRIDELLGKLNYPRLDEMGTFVPRDGAAMFGECTDPIKRLLSDQLPRRMRSVPDHVDGGRPVTGSIKIILVDVDAAPWIVDFTTHETRRGSEGASITIKTSQPTLLAIRDGLTNPGSAIRAGDLSLQPTGPLTPSEREGLVDCLCQLIRMRHVDGDHELTLVPPASFHAHAFAAENG
jgi:protein-tyrosine sulfotransferase